MAILRLHRQGDIPFELQTGLVQIGRDSSADWVIPDKSVSRKHATIEERDGVFWLVDQGSANGTFVDGQRQAEVRLRDGAELRLGTVSLRVEIEAELAGTVLMSAPALEEQGRTVLMPVPDLSAPPYPAAAPPPVAPPVTRALTADLQAEARALLGVAQGASAAEIQARYDEAVQDIQTKLAGAQTSTLQATYQRNLEALAEARRLLVPGLLTEDVVADLPAVQPSVGPDSLDMSDMRGAVAEPIQVTSDPSRQRGGWPAGMTFFIFVSTFSLAAFAFFALSTQKMNKELAKVTGDPEFAKVREEALLFQTAATLQKAGVLLNGQLRLCNKSAVPVPVRWLGAVRLAKGEVLPNTDLELAKEASGYKVETFNSAFCPEVRFTLAPGEERAINYANLDGRCKWDGSAVFWSIAYEVRPEPPPVEVAAPKGKKPPTPAAPPEPVEVYESGLLDPKSGCVAIGGGTQ